MATEEHKRLANIIKSCHDSLRLLTKQHGAEKAWQEHLKDTERLKEYAAAMHQLANIWGGKYYKSRFIAQSRIKWTMEYCMAYFFANVSTWRKDYGTTILDVGSCFNPFGKSFDVTAIDLCPATNEVFKGDFLKIQINDTNDLIFENGEVTTLPKNYYECVIFSLLLEYIPTSQLRLECCRKAYDLLKFEGILIIITPDSQHVGKNAAIMKNWRYTLGCMGFTRIRFEKLPHITCMVFRKACDARVAQRWSELHKEPYMSLTIDIPQDNKTFDI
ncbi:hypothetical protein DOY81_010268 [Sarcophaga bullata]|nr:hypothetical protein DOY81_010268 [Sarcophaga bullata]